MKDWQRRPKWQWQWRVTIEVAAYTTLNLASEIYLSFPEIAFWHDNLNSIFIFAQFIFNSIRHRVLVASSYCLNNEFVLFCFSIEFFLFSECCFEGSQGPLPIYSVLTKWGILFHLSYHCFWTIAGPCAAKSKFSGTKIQCSNSHSDENWKYRCIFPERSLVSFVVVAE